MSTYQFLKTADEDGIRTVTITRPESLNALNVQTIDEIREVVMEAYDNVDIKGMIFTGEGEKAFVAGADIKEISELNEVNARKFAENGQEILALIENLEKPVIAAVNGFALGGGCELAMACHMRIATENAKFGQPEVNLGLIPGYGGTQRLTQLVGKGKAIELMITGDTLSAEQALALGLVNYVVETKEELIAKSRALLEKALSKAPIAVGMAISSVNAYYDDEGKGYRAEANSFMNCCKTSDFKEGTTAFIEKRKPAFTGE